MFGKVDYGPDERTLITTVWFLIRKEAKLTFEGSSLNSILPGNWGGFSQLPDDFPRLQRWWNWKYKRPLNDAYLGPGLVASW